MSELIEKFIAVAESQLGVEEEPRGSNWGTRVADYLASVRISQPASWCAAFVFWTYKKTMTGVTQKFLLPQTGHANTMYNLAAKYQVAKGDTPKRGDIFTLLTNPKTGAGHTGIVTGVNLEAGTYDTIEGNTNDEGSREGYEVCRRTRKLSAKELRGFIRIIP